MRRDCNGDGRIPSDTSNTVSLDRSVIELNSEGEVHVLSPDISNLSSVLWLAFKMLTIGLHNARGLEMWETLRAVSFFRPSPIILSPSDLTLLHHEMSKDLS